MCLSLLLFSLALTVLLIFAYHFARYLLWQSFVLFLLAIQLLLRLLEALTLFLIHSAAFLSSHLARPARHAR